MPIGRQLTTEEPGAAAEDGGELAAHEEMTAKYNVHWRKVHDSCWECLSVGAYDLD